MRRRLIVGNWKMNATEPGAAALLDALLPLLPAAGSGPEIALAPPFTSLRSVGERLRGAGVALAAQSLHTASHGAFTGEISGPMLAALGVRYVIVGHSERRRLCREDDEEVGRKAAAARAAGLVPILCVGEEEADRLEGRTIEVIERQVRAGIGKIEVTDGERTVIAYEPVWAIGTGRSATLGQIREAHEALRHALGRAVGDSTAGLVRILYGGSVTAENAAAILACEGVDGALVGGASLLAGPFSRIVASALA